MLRLSPLEQLICEFDNALHTIFGTNNRPHARPTPAEKHPESPLTTKEKRHVGSLVRVNHAGEVSAQALYQGQALTAQLSRVKAQMKQAAEEEIDHLAWCEQRLMELGDSTSVLNPFWYTGSFMIGALAGLAGDRWSLGFVAETERQVTAHLQKHLAHLPPDDLKTKAILAQMQEDEAHHAEVALEAGAAELPFAIKQAMRVVSKLLTKFSYYI